MFTDDFDQEAQLDILSQAQADILGNHTPSSIAQLLESLTYNIFT
jgi:hypothetical protein